MSRSRHAALRLSLLGGLLMSVSVLAAEPVSPGGLPRSTVVDKAGSETDDPLPIASLQLFADVYEKIRRNYVRSVPESELFDGALGGMLSQLDPYSEYLTSDEYNALQEFTDGDLGQMGFDLEPVGGEWHVTRLNPTASARKQGLSNGDTVLRLNGRLLRNLSQHEVDQLLRGPQGSSVRLQVVSGSSHRARELRVQRMLPEDNQVLVRPASDGIVVLQIGGFQSQTGQQIRAALDPLMQRGQLRGVVLDVRDNPGGLLSAAVEVADQFLSQGTIVSTRGRGEPDQSYPATPEEPYAGVPVAMLMNSYSASASEVLAAALRDNQRAQLYGTPSYGKGSVQKLWPVGNDRAVKMTVSYYYTPNNTRLEGIGLQPNVAVPAADEPVQLRGPQLDEAQREVVNQVRRQMGLPSLIAVPAAADGTNLPKRASASPVVRPIAKAVADAKTD